MNLLRPKSICKRLDISRTHLHNQIKAGLLPPFISLGANIKCLPSYELDQIISAAIAGNDDKQVKKLVIKIVSNRKAVA